MRDFADKIRLIGDGTRFRILRFLADPIQSHCSRADGVCACDFETFLGLTQPTISYHMKQLVEAGFVTADRRGRWVYYELVPAAFREVTAVLESFARAGEEARQGAAT